MEPERAGVAGGAVNTFRQLGHALAVAVLGTVLTSTMRDSLSHGAAHTLAGCGARALDGVVPEHTLRVAFASGLNTASVVAGCAALVAGVLVLALVRAPRAAHRPRERPPPRSPGTVVDRPWRNRKRPVRPKTPQRTPGKRSVQIPWRLRHRNLLNRKNSVPPFPLWPYFTG